MFEPIVLLAVMAPMAVHLMVLVQPLVVMPPKGPEVLLPKKSHLKKRGRKPGRQIELALPKPGTKVALKPSGDE